MKIKQEFLEAIQTHKNMPELIADALKNSILQGELKGGVPLKQDELAKQFQASLIPVREALIQLESQGLVKMIRNKGAVVTKLSLRELKESFELREIIEVGVCDLIDEEQIQASLETMRWITNKMAESRDAIDFQKYNRLFHEAFIRMPQNAELVKIYQRLFIHVERYLIYMEHFIPIKEQVLEDHLELLELLETQKIQVLKQKLRRHIQGPKERIMAYFKEQYPGREIDINVIDYQY